jgi:heme-degrading monooxygenase HmoA
MYARVTTVEIDTMRVDVDKAIDLFERQVLPRLRELPGYEGAYVFATPEGRGLLISMWSTAEAADSQSDTGFYAEVLAEYVTLFRSPPGRESYEVAVADLPRSPAGR